MDVIRFAWESGLFLIPFVPWQPLSFFLFWGAVLLGGTGQTLLLRFTKRKAPRILLPALFFCGMLVFMILGQGVTGWDVFLYMIPWFGFFALLIGTGIAEAAALLFRRIKK